MRKTLNIFYAVIISITIVAALVATMYIAYLMIPILLLALVGFSSYTYFKYKSAKETNNYFSTKY